MICPACHAEINPGAAFCNQCGASLAGAAPAGGPAVTTLPSQASGLSNNTAAALAYVTIIPAILFLLIEPYNRNAFVRFHAFQSIFLGVAALVAHLFLGFVPVFGWIIMPLLGIFCVVVWILTMVKAAMGEWFKLPVIGNLALQQSKSA